MNRDNPEDGTYSVVALFRDAAPQASAGAFAKLQSAYVGACNRIGELLAEKQTCAEDVRNAALEALEAARRFIRNGIEFGYIRMPDADTPDPAHHTPGLIDAAIRALKRPQAAQDARACPCPSGDGSLRHPCAAHPAKPAETKVNNGQIRDNLPRLGHHRLYRGCDPLEDSRRNLAGRQGVDPGTG